MESYLAARTRLIEQGAPGTMSARRLSDLTDEAVRALAAAASSQIHERWALLALGGWGRGQLLPASDLDLLVLSESPAERLEPFVQRLLYPLWDAGLKVGHQVRSPKQQRRAMREDITCCTAALTARPLAGDRAWAEECALAWVDEARKRRKTLLAELSRRDRGGSPYLLEPDLKQGAGGRRDYDELIWTATLLGDGLRPSLSPLVAQGVLSDPEHAALEESAQVTSAARWQLQKAGLGDRLTSETDEELLGFDPEKVQAALGTTAALLEDVRDRLTGRTTDDGPLDGPALFAILEGHSNAETALLRAAQAGRFEALVPGFRGLLSCRRPGLGHELTVGAHSIRAAALALKPPPGDAALARSIACLDDQRVVLAACLTHDVGKRRATRDHAVAGAGDARDAADRLGLDEQAAEQVAKLTRLHLLLAETALREDLDDEDTVLRCAARVGDPSLPPALHVLAAADARATGRSTWTAWIASLVGTLVARLDAALSPEVDGAGLATRGEAVRVQALSLAPYLPPAAADFVTHAPLRYLAARTPGETVRHAELVAGLAATGAATSAAMEVTSGPAEGTYSLTIAAVDRPDLLARLAGAIALAGLDILAVDAQGGGSGVALDSFVVASATGRAVDTDTFERLERLTRAALTDRLELAVRLAERRKHYRQRVTGAPRIETRQVGWATELRVTAPDRVALLYDVARAVSSSDLTIRWAKVQTVENVARDVFHLSGPDGGPVTDPGLLGHLTMRLRETL